MIARRRTRVAALVPFAAMLAPLALGDPAGASVPAPVDPAAASAAAGPGLRAYFAGLGELVYRGDDLLVGECPLIGADVLAAALAPLADDVELTADEAEVEGLTADEPDDGDVVVPALVGCEFDGDERIVEDVTVAALDLSADEATAWLEQFPTDDVGAIEADWADEGTLRGECRDDSCLALWANDQLAVIALIDLEDPADDEQQAAFGPVAAEVIWSAILALAAQS